MTRAEGRLGATLWVGLTLVSMVLLAAFVSLFWTPWSTIYTDVAHAAVTPGTAGHLLGTDFRGRDIASLLMAGAQNTLYAGGLAVTIGVVGGTSLGLLAGMASHGWQELLLRVTDLWLAFPALLLALTLDTIWGSSLTSGMVAVGIASIPAFGRIVRAGTIVVMRLDYIDAARVAGRSTIGIAISHVLPNVRSTLITQSAVSFSVAILAEASLSYLGLGAGPTTPSWGRMLYDGSQALYVQPVMLLWPGLAIVIAILGFNLLGDGLRDRLDPRLLRADSTVPRPLG